MNRLIVIVSGASLAAVGIIGCIDASRSNETGLTILFGILVIGVAGLTVAQAAHHGIELRQDLATWVERTSAATGETPEEMTSRAVSRLRSGFGSTTDDPR